MLTLPVAFFDPPLVVNATVTPIPSSSSLPLQVIASTGINLGIGINYQDTTGEFIGVYIGPKAQEVLICVIGNGLSSQAWGRFPPNSRVSLRNMNNTNITNGLLWGQIAAI